jgi:hypothetical protein
VLQSSSFGSPISSAWQHGSSFEHAVLPTGDPVLSSLKGNISCRISPMADDESDELKGVGKASVADGLNGGFSSCRYLCLSETGACIVAS